MIFPKTFCRSHQEEVLSTRGTRPEAGFTLLELTAAITLLGFAFVTLLGLQTRLIDTFMQERNHFRAALAAQYLMALVEIEEDPPAVGSQESELISALNDKGYFEGDSGEELRKAIEGWRSNIVVTSVDFPGLQADVLRRVDISVSWGDSERERYTLVHFMKTKLLQNSGLAQ